MSEVSEPEEPDSPCGWPLMAPATPAIETRRLILRPPVDADAEAIARLADTAAVARSLIGMPHPYRVGHARAWLAEPVDPRGQRHLICRKGFDAAPTPVGVITLDMRGRAGPGWIGCWLGERHWGQGFATEACHAAIDYAFLHQRHDKLLFACRVTNPAGRRVIEKCGFQMVAQELASVAGSGAAVAIDRFRIDRRTWESIRAWEPLRVHHREAAWAERGDSHGEPLRDYQAPAERI
ncbi:GNAT family N-acetyltransferase [Pleomorphomonas koreensis]|uniref:GNAT family N-acetyltransferase n=1 Tax=Pleomorphomonas koreensis TaxID=257440 RepID=UPI000418B161|nr:GNAT family N-acetyltransferase [Pleomorphomonas koreensis]